ncbi:hypothetical protein BJX63DRAFT_435119 [Aspergillus granulosus]|uniref:Uncharacterized protein n=1 Tax=Aspergillus granulosus TaxID=176169 RepID=A0ABR4H1X5_9EURO
MTSRHERQDDVPVATYTTSPVPEASSPWGFPCSAMRWTMRIQCSYRFRVVRSSLVRLVDSQGWKEGTLMRNPTFLERDERGMINQSNAVKGGLRQVKPGCKGGYNEGPGEDDLPAETEETGQSNTRKVSEFGLLEELKLSRDG